MSTTSMCNYGFCHITRLSCYIGNLKTFKLVKRNIINSIDHMTRGMMSQKIKVPNNSMKHIHMAIEWLMRNNQSLSRFLQVLLTNSEFHKISDIIVMFECRTCGLRIIQKLAEREALIEFAYSHRAHRIFFEAELTRN